MKVKNLLVNKEFVDILVKELILNNESYLLIDPYKQESLPLLTPYKELHYKDNIYRFFEIENFKLSNFEKYNSAISFISDEENLNEIIINKKEKKEKTGYKKLNKQLIKETNQHVKRRK